MHLLWFGGIIAYNLASGAVFGRLVHYATFPERSWRPAGWPAGTLTLDATRRGSREGIPDEREIAVRNAAYFTAFRALGTYAMIFWLVMPVLWAFGRYRTIGILPTELLALPLVTMAVTLPQAVVLWTEPDVPEEARV